MTEKDWCPWLSIQQFFVICAGLDSKYNNKQYYNSKKIIIEINGHWKDTARVGVVGKELKRRPNGNQHQHEKILSPTRKCECTSFSVSKPSVTNIYSLTL